MANHTLQNRYLEWVGVAIILLALGRCAFGPGVDDSGSVSPSVAQETQLGDSAQQKAETLPAEATQAVASQTETAQVATSQIETIEVDAAPRKLSFSQKPHKILSVSNYKTAFPDTNATQLKGAQRWGVTPVKDRADAENRRNQLVYVGASPYYHVDPLTQSIPYLVPRAAILLEDIGRAFYDSLQMKGVPLHQFIVTSVLRTQADVRKLRRFNGNATENSCHLYGTTFDIAYNRYFTVEDPEGEKRHRVRDDSLKWVLSEVLRDMREQKRCYIKYEVKQGCFHMTVR